MRRANRILLMATIVAVGVESADGAIWNRRKAQPKAAQAGPAAAAGIALSAVESDATRITLRTTGAPAYTSYSPSPAVFVVDLTSTTRESALTIPSTLPAGVSSITAEETTEMGMRLTRVTFHLHQPQLLQASALDNAVVVHVPGAVAAVRSAAPAVVAAAPARATIEPLEPAVATASLPPERDAAPVSRPARSITMTSAAGPKATLLRDVQMTAEGDLRLVGDGTPSYKSFRLENPARLVLDLEGVRNRVGRSLITGSGAVRRIRVSQFQPAPNAVTRVVLELQPAASYQLAAAADGLRVVFGNGGIVREDAPVQVASASPAKPVATTAASEVSIFEEAPAHHAKAVITSTEDQAPPATPQPPPPDDVLNEQAPASTATTRLTGGNMQTTGARAGGTTQKVYTGEPISLTLKEAPIRDVLATFSAETGLNIAVDPQVQGTVTVNFTDVPWDQALDIILNQNGLTWVLNGNVMRVGTVERLAAERQAARKLEEEERLNVQLDTYAFKLSYARATDVSGLLKDVASSRAKVIVDNRTNTLIVSEIPSYLKVINDLIATIDIPTKQVMIEARIVEVSKTFSQQFGFQWGFGGAFDPALGTGTGLVFPNRIAFTGGPFEFGPGNTVLQFRLFDVLGAFDLDFALNASEAEGFSKVISAPRITTQDNIPAEIQSGIQFPIQTRINFTTTIQYIDATLRLGVTPQITAEGTVIMDISVQKNQPTPGLSIAGSAGTPLQTRTARTRLMVRDGGTAVIGGIYQVTDNNSQTRLPFVHQIPVIGNLFKTHDISSTRDELLIFITPRIIRSF